MSGNVEAVTAQLRDELGAVARAVGGVVGPELGLLIEDRTHETCVVLAAELCSDEDRPAAEAVLTVMSVLWPDGTEPPPEWWRTPAGRMVARSVGRDDSESVTRSVAAAMLGVSPGSVAQWVHRGNLDRHPDGGITRASVLLRLARD